MDKDFKYWILGIATGLIFAFMIMAFNKNKYYIVDDGSRFFAVVNTNNGNIKRYSFNPYN